jgi:hypothetical protein
MAFRVSPLGKSLITAVSVSVLVSAAATAATDPYIATYEAKDPNNYFSIIKKLVLSNGKGHRYNARMEISHYLDEENGKSIALEGYADVYLPADDKTDSDRFFVYFPKAKYPTFLEIYPGQKSSPNNLKGYKSLHYRYFEKASGHHYVTDELIRELPRKK